MEICNSSITMCSGKVRIQVAALLFTIVIQTHEMPKSIKSIKSIQKYAHCISSQLRFNTIWPCSLTVAPQCTAVPLSPLSIDTLFSRPRSACNNPEAHWARLPLGAHKPCIAAAGVVAGHVAPGHVLGWVVIDVRHSDHHQAVGVLASSNQEAGPAALEGRALLGVVEVATTHRKSFGAEESAGCRRYIAAGLGGVKMLEAWPFPEEGRRAREVMQTAPERWDWSTCRPGNKRTPNMNPAHSHCCELLQASHMLAWTAPEGCRTCFVAAALLMVGVACKMHMLVAEAD
jgi:hypothetical protein